MNVQAAKAARIPTAAVTGLIVDAMIEGRRCRKTTPSKLPS